MFLNLKLKITKAVLLLLVLNVFSPALSVMAETLSDKDIVFEKTENLYYSKLMREVRLIKEGKVDNTKEAKLQAIDDLERFMEEEKTRLEKLGVDREKQEKYFELLELQLTDVKSQTDTSLDEFEKVTEFYKETVLPLGESLDSVKESQFFNSTKELRIENLEKPSKFYFGDDEVIIKSLKSLEVEPDIGEKLSQFFGVETAYAVDAQYLPVVEDIQADDEVVISSSIRDLAYDLNNNPVEIFNYVRNNITYEPYFGAKKGSVGCLQERVCNDVDTASLTIALMRAAGIPARYKKGLAVLPVEQLQNLLGVDETKTVYYVFYTNNVPVYVLHGSMAGVDIDLADFTYETHLVLDWVNVEIFYDYDERGANIPNIMDLSEVATTQDLQALLTDSDKKQWIPVDAVIKVYDRTQNEIVHDTANFDAMAFWLDFLQYQGDLSPIAKYIQDLLTQTGSDITLAQYQSTKEIQPRQFDILPSSLSYILSQGTPSGGDPILMETWSQLPNDHRYQVTLSLLHESDSSVVFSNTFFGSEINNKGVDLMYQGATPADEAVIESYGGIHATPAALVDIQPYFLTDSGRYEGASDVSIGESLILQFEYSVGGDLIYTDQKYSVAGNQEGIYMILSKVLDNPYFTDGLNDNSEILLEGNTGLAWKYIREVEADSDLLAKALDYEYNLEFFRAVVTQNRVLAEVGGVPTTFDFEGLTIDASSYINDYSNRGNFKEHQEDFRLLWGEQASYYEGQLFTDVAGLEGISTVKGLQYAYANPGTYTVHIIDSSNESVIDTLTLSANTKANMHADVQAGNTIITPDKPVVRENFDGSLYISLASDGTGTYAIGEQVANGAWTVDVVTVEIYCDTECHETYQVNNVTNNLKFIFAEREDVDSVICSIDLDGFYDITNNVDVLPNPELWQLWGPGYGAPCLKETKYFEGIEHTFILATNGAKFTSPATDLNYDYWVPREIARQIVENNVSNYNDNNFKFNPVAGTYSHNVFGEGVYYEPREPLATPPPGYTTGWTDTGISRAVTDEFIEKLGGEHYSPERDNDCGYGTYYCGKKDYVLNKLGFPTSEVIVSDESFAEETGSYQNFAGGRIYNLIRLEKVVYIPNYILNFYNNVQSTTCIEVGNESFCGSESGGAHGFPLDDPIYDESTNQIKQRFERNYIHYDFDSLSHHLSAEEDHERRYNNKLYGNTIYQEVTDGEITDVEAFAKISDFIAANSDSNDQFVDDLAMFFLGTDSVITSSENPNKEFVTSWLWSDTGFDFDYNDSHYCMQRNNDNKLNPYDCLSNQLYHSMGGFVMAYDWTYIGGYLANRHHDDDINPLGFGGESIEDVNLGDIMALFGDLLRAEFATSKEDMGAFILNEIADNNYLTLAKPRTELSYLAEYRKKFRVFEYELNGNINGEWDYSNDIKEYSCTSGIDLYYQDYNFFNGDGLPGSGNSRAIWNQNDNRMIYLPNLILNQYPNMNSICSDLSTFTNNFGYVLRLEFYNPGGPADPNMYLLDRLKDGQFAKPDFI